MNSCRICGAATARARPLCRDCGQHLGTYQTTRSADVDAAIPVRRYGCVPPPAPTVLHADAPPAAPRALAPTRLVPMLATAWLVGALALVWLLLA